jgi:hypothetical protein
MSQLETIDFPNIVQAYVRIVPGATDALQMVPEPQRSEFIVWPEGRADMFDFLPMAFVRPILMPKLLEEQVDRETLHACFIFIEGLARNKNSHIQNALYFELYERFLDSREILLKAEEFSGPATSSELLQILTEQYPDTLKNQLGEETDEFLERLRYRRR